mgnify:CR=1 FL=1
MSDVVANAQAGQMMTADGIPLKKSLKASLRREKLPAFGLVAVPALFILILFVWPIYALFQKRIDYSFVNDVLTPTMAIYEHWDGVATPGPPHF